MCCTSVGNKELHWLRRSKAVNAVSTHGLVHLLIKKSFSACLFNTYH